MVIAAAGRRIDRADAETPRFPLENVTRVEHELEALFVREGATVLVTSAACGADLVALTVAGRRHMRRRVILPLPREVFRTTSVTDRPGDWGPILDRVLAELDRTGDVVILGGGGEGDAAYLAANEAIVAEAATLAQASGSEAIGVLIWEGARRGADDVTAAFGDTVRRRGWRLAHVKTVEDPMEP